MSIYQIINLAILQFLNRFKMAPTSQKNQTKKRVESNSISQPIRKEILCDGWYYDVTEFARRHPGGSIIDYYTKTGEDATLAIQQFHQRSPMKIKAILKSFKRRPAEDKEGKRVLNLQLPVFFLTIPIAVL